MKIHSKNKTKAGILILEKQKHSIFYRRATLERRYRGPNKIAPMRKVI